MTVIMIDVEPLMRSPTNRAKRDTSGTCLLNVSQMARCPVVLPSRSVVLGAKHASYCATLPCVLHIPTAVSCHASCCVSSVHSARLPCLFHPYSPAIRPAVLSYRGLLPVPAAMRSAVLSYCHPLPSPAALTCHASCCDIVPRSPACSCYTPLPCVLLGSPTALIPCQIMLHFPAMRPAVLSCCDPLPIPAALPCYASCCLCVLYCLACHCCTSLPFNLLSFCNVLLCQFPLNSPAMRPAELCCCAPLCLFLLPFPAMLAAMPSYHDSLPAPA